VQGQGLEVLPELIQIVINAAMQAEHSEYLQAEPYQHTPERIGHANRFKPKTLRTRISENSIKYNFDWHNCQFCLLKTILMFVILFNRVLASNQVDE